MRRKSGSAQRACPIDIYLLLCMVNGKKQYIHFIMTLLGIPRKFIYLFLFDLVEYRVQDAYHGSRSSGVHGNLERGVPRNDSVGRCETLRDIALGTLCVARSWRGGFINHAPAQ